MSEVLRHAWAETALGRFLVASSERGVVYLGLREARSWAGLEDYARRKSPGAELVEDAHALKPLRDELAAWADGDLRKFHVPIDLRGTPFQLACWDQLQRIPYGTTITYNELARRVDRPRGASRAVGQANGANPVAIVVPCHRVLATTGLGGFGGGIEMKRRMLELEGALLPLG
ncbi:MAG: methylated-DNA--[protein]-cysteine S-methyltransferase [Planctomycetota bacterium]|nr:methylated-DNA--[protein]-cysteine S-methyltransferase [Planctomycetota bacterium]